MGEKRQYIVIFLLLATGLVSNYLYLRNTNPVTQKLPIEVPLANAGWQGAPYYISDSISRGSEISREYRFQDGMPMNFLVLLKKNASHDPWVCYSGLGWNLTETKALTTSSKKIVMAGLQGRMKNREIIIYYGFLIGTRIIADGIERKFHESLQRVLYGYDRQVFIEVTTVVPEGEIKTAEAYLQKFLEDMESNLLVKSQ
ncbi:MAG: EpsI family protein [Syntrophales bacterium]|jgi:EpsI family protein|nr:EpsI family protein [Syntrophales bacterium]